MRRQYQFQSLAEPVSTRASIWIDRWMPKMPEQIALVKVGITAAILAGSFCYVSESRSLVDLTEWQVKVEDRQPVKPVLPEAITAGSFFGPVTFKEDVRIDRFEPKVHDGRMWVKQGLSEAVLAGSYSGPILPRPTSADLAGGLSLHSIKRFQFQSLTQPVYVAPVIPPVWPEQNHTAYPEAVRGTPPLPAAIQAGSFFFQRYFPKVEYVYSDKWGPTYQDRIPPKPTILPAIQAGSFFTGNPSIVPFPYIFVQVDKWIPTYETLVRPKERLIAAIQAGDFFFIGEGMARYETTYLVDKWNPTYPDMLRRKQTLLDAINAGSFFVLPGGEPLPVAGGIFVYIWKRIA